MSQKDLVYSRANLSRKAALKYKLHKRKKRREMNKFEEVTTLEVTSMPMRISAESLQNQNGDEASGQVRVSYDEQLPFMPTSLDILTEGGEGYNEESGFYAIDMCPILQTNTLVQPVPMGTTLRTQNHGGEGGPGKGNFKKMRPVSTVVSQNPAAYSAFGFSKGGRLNNLSWGGSLVNPSEAPGPPPDPWKNVWIEGSEFPADPIKYTYRAEPNKHIKNEIIPILDGMSSPMLTKGMRALIIVHAMKEGYKPGTRSYRHKNPGNVGNTDSGANKTLPSLEKGITYLMEYINRVANGQQSAYKFGPKTIKPYFSKEMDRNRAVYKKSPYLPGYKFEYTGQIDQYVKIYATGSRAGNSYINLILSYFKKHLNVTLTPQSKIQDIIKIN